VAVEDFHVTVGAAGMVYVVCAVAAARAVNAPALVHFADSQLATACAPPGLAACDSLALVLRYLSTTREEACGETTFAVNWRCFNRQAMGEFQSHSSPDNKSRSHPFEGSKRLAISKIRFVKLLKMKAARDVVRLVAYDGQAVAQAREAQTVYRALVGHQVVYAPGHWLAAARKFVGDSHAFQAPGESFLPALYKARQETQFRIKLAVREILRGRAALDHLFAHAQVAFIALAVDELGVLVNAVRLGYDSPRWRRQFKNVINAIAAESLRLRQDSESTKNSGRYGGERNVQASHFCKTPIQNFQEDSNLARGV